MVETVQKQKQERIRGPAIEVFKTYKEGVSFPDALKLAEEAKGVLVSNERHDEVLVKRDAWRHIQKGYPCWTGTMAAYEEPNKKLGKEIVYTDPKTKQRYIFPTGDAEGSRNVVLVAEHPDYTLVEDGENLIVRASLVDILEDFPVSDGQYRTDEKHGIPIGRQVDAEREDALCLWKEARYLWRIDKRVGPAVRSCDVLSNVYRTHGFVLNDSPSREFGVMVETNKKNERTVTADNISEKELLNLCGEFVKGATKITEAEFINKLERGITKLEEQLPNTEPEKQKELKEMIKTLRDYIEATS
ncbi:hypothetical protein KAW38_04280 [Candidatus Micrarchaeota archaeon]|nr:hypothetical protein [Candidatus Micrarchaeota archaeon]